jgi:hypothetical protein
MSLQQAKSPQEREKDIGAIIHGLVAFFSAENSKIASSGAPSESDICTKAAREFSFEEAVVAFGLKLEPAEVPAWSVEVA